MIRILLLLIKLALIVAAAVWLTHRPGDVQINWLGYRVHTSFAIMMVVIALLVVVATALYTLWRSVIAIPRSFLLGHLSRRQRKGYIALTQGLAAVAAGDGKAAQKYANQAESYLKDPSLTLLLQAQAAQMNGHEAKAMQLYNQMIAQPKTSAPGLRGLLQQSMHQGLYEEALEIAHRAEIMQPRADWVLQALVELNARLGNWDAALKALSVAVKQGAMTPEQGKHMRSTIYIALGQLSERDHEYGMALHYAKRAYNTLPHWAPAVGYYAKLLIRAKNLHAAAKVIERTWRFSPHPLLARFYEDAIAHENAPERVKRFERLASFNPSSVESQRWVAKAALNAQLWGIARSYLEPLAVRDTHAETFYLLAELDEKQNADVGSAKKWIQKAAHSDADPVWFCTICHQSDVHWYVACQTCGAVASLVWQKSHSGRGTGWSSSSALALASPAAETKALSKV